MPVAVFCFVITYPMAIVEAGQFGRLVAADRAAAIRAYKAALTLGNTRSLPDLFGVVGIAFPFSPQAVEDALHFIQEH